MTSVADSKKNGGVSYKMLAGWLVAVVVTLVSTGYQVTTAPMDTRLLEISEQQKAIVKAVGVLNVSIAVMETRFASFRDTNDKEYKNIKGEIQEIKRKLN